MTEGMGISKAPFTVAGKSSYYYKIDGKRKSLSTDKKDEARKRLDALRKLYFQGKLSRLTGEGGTAKTLEDFAEEYMEWSWRARPHATARADKIALDRLMDVAGKSIRVVAITRQHADKIKALGLKPRSINTYLRTLRPILQKAVDWGVIQRNPFAGIRMVPVLPEEPVYIHPGEVSRFLFSIKDLDARRMVTAYIYSGRRRAELVGLMWSDVDMSSERYTIRKAKRHLTKTYDMHPIFKAVLTAIGPQEHGPVFSRWRHPATVTHRVKDALRDFGLGHVHLHHMRHTFAVLLREEGVDIKTIADLMGHRDVRATEIYANITDTRAARALKLIKGGPVEL